MADDVLFAHLDHGAPVGNNVPRRLEKLPGERVQDDVYSESFGEMEDLMLKLGCARGEDVVGWDVEGLVEELALLVRSGRDKKLRNNVSWRSTTIMYKMVDSPLRLRIDKSARQHFQYLQSPNG